MTYKHQAPAAVALMRSQVFSVLATVAFALCALVLGLRLASAVSFREPFLGNTSGLEEEALFSVWRVIQGQSPYTDVFAPPFSTSYFNWLFYYTYAAWGELWEPLWRADEAWLPTVWRSLSFCFMAGTGWVTWAILARQIRSSRGIAALTLACAAGICVVNPLFNWWSFTVRPDIGALFFEVVGFALLARGAAGLPLRWVVPAGLAVAIAWSFKQSHVFMFAGGICFLALHRRWYELCGFAAPLLVMVAATFWFSGPWYYQNTIELHLMEFHLFHGVALVAQAMVKAPLMLAGLLASVPLIFTWGSAPAFLRLSCLVTLVSFPLSVVASAKTGASDNYYLSVSVFASITAITLTHRWLTAQHVLGRAVVVLAAMSVVGQATVAGLVLGGLKGRLDIGQDGDLAAKLRQRLAHEQGPILISARPLNLPWIHPGRPPFVYSYLYPSYEQRYPERLGQTGIRSLVRDQYFRVIVDVPGAAADLMPELTTAYVLVEGHHDFRIYRPRS